LTKALQASMVRIVMTGRKETSFKHVTVTLCTAPVQWLCTKNRLCQLCTKRTQCKADVLQSVHFNVHATRKRASQQLGTTLTARPCAHHACEKWQSCHDKQQSTTAAGYSMPDCPAYDGSNGEEGCRTTLEQKERPGALATMVHMLPFETRLSISLCYLCFVAQQ
jgi:hypothetical protein